MPCVNARTTFPGKLEKSITFLVDLGAERTAVSEEDAVKIGLDYGKLEKAERNIGGIGGKVETYTAEVVLKIQPDFIDKRKILVMKNKIPDNISNNEKNQLKNFYQRIPSLLGRDIICEFWLFIHEKTEMILMMQDNEIHPELFEF